MLYYYISEREPKQKSIDFEFLREFLMKEDNKMVAKRRF